MGNTSTLVVSDNNLKNSAGNEYSIASDKKELLTIFKSKFYFNYTNYSLSNTNSGTNIEMIISREYFRFLSTTDKITCVPLAASVIAFSLICAIAHGLVLYSGKKFNGKANYYQMILVNKINYFRWFEYTISSAIMVVNIAALARISSVYQLANIAILTGITNLFGLWMEQTDVNSPRAISGSRIIAFVAGFITFFPPWIIIINKFVKDGRYFKNEVLPFIEASSEEETELPSFLQDYDTYVKIAAYGLFGIYFLFPLNMFLQYWIYPKYFEKKAYYYGEIGYIFLSMISKVFLSLTIFIGALQPTDGGQPVNCGN